MFHAEVREDQIEVLLLDQDECICQTRRLVHLVAGQPAQRLPNHRTNIRFIVDNQD